ncbi:MAG: amidohydrolase [Clostridia bacterium]|nr:amidohydrolase [Clostridia bacterium]
MTKLLIKNGYVVTVDDDFTIYPKGAVYVKNGRIVEVGDSSVLEKKYEVQGVETIDAQGKAVIPGLINTHLHSGIIRGTAEDLPLWEWISKHVDPKHKVLTAEDAYVASSLCYGESLLAGTTCVVDMYRFMDRCADAAEETGIRAVLVPYVADRPNYSYFETIEDNIRLVEERHGSANDRIHVWFGLEHLVYCTEEAYHRVADLAVKYGVGIHTHGEESIDMVQRISRKYGCSPIQLFYNRGILGPKTLLAHCVWLTPIEMELLAKTGTSVAHCPISNMKLASGVAPIPAYLAKGISVGLATDGVKENNNLDLFEEMKFASLLQKVHHLNAELMPAEETLRIATIYGAKAIGLDHEIGSIEAGKKADLVLVNLRRLHMAPILEDDYANIVANIVFSANGGDVDTVLVDGKVVVEEHKLMTVDEEYLIDKATQTTKALIERRRPFVPDAPTIDDIEV